MERQFLDGFGALRRLSGAPTRWLIGLVLCATSMATLAAGTDAGRRIDNVAQAAFDVAGVPQPVVSSNTVAVVVDEVLDEVVVATDAGSIPVASGATNAVLSFSVTNAGNGSEALRLVVDVALLGDDFDPTVSVVYLESNGTPGLQLGPGGDTIYSPGTNDPVLVRDASLSVYVAANIPVGLAPGALGNVALRAVAQTVFVKSGTDDPANPAFPIPGTAYAGAGDAAIGGGGNVTAVVGTSYSSAALQLRAQGSYRVGGAVVTLNKVAASIIDPFGGNTLVTGSVIGYRITVDVNAGSTAQNLVIRDPLPGDLAYVAGSLAVSALPSGQQADDDFAPAGSDGTGFDGANNTVVVALGDAVGGGVSVVISFNTTIR